MEKLDQKLLKLYRLSLNWSFQNWMDNSKTEYDQYTFKSILNYVCGCLLFLFSSVHKPNSPKKMLNIIKVNSAVSVNMRTQCEDHPPKSPLTIKQKDDNTVWCPFTLTTHNGTDQYDSAHQNDYLV